MITIAKQSVRLLQLGSYNARKRQKRSLGSENDTLTFPALILLFGCLAITAFVRYRLIFIANSDIGGIESNVIYSIQRYMAGYALYANPEVAPYSITQYSPFYYRVVAAFGYLVDINPDNALSVYKLSRVISLSANIIYALLVGICSYRFHPNAKVNVAVAVIAFVLLPPQTYSRPDSIYIVLVIATLYAGLRAIQAIQLVEKYCWLILAVFTTALAIATKQSGIVLAITMTSYYAFFRGQWLTAISMGLGIGLLSMFFLIGLMPEHDPTLLYVNVVTGVSQGLDWPSFKINIVDHFFRTFSLHNAIGLPLCVWLIHQSKPGYTWLGWFVLVLFGFSFLTSLKWGSALNYYTEYVALVALVAVIWVHEQRLLLFRRERSWSLLMISYLFWAVVPNVPNFNWPIIMQADVRSESAYTQQKEVADYVTDSLNLRSSDAVFVTNFNYCFLNGLLYRNCLIPQQDMVAAVMYPRKKLDYSAFDQQIDRRNIRFLITRTNETNTLFPGLTTARYHLRRRFSQFDVYESF